MPQWINQRSLLLGIPWWFNGSAPHSALSLCVGAQLLGHVQFFATNSSDCSPPGSSVHEIFQARILEWVLFLLQWIFPTQESNPSLLRLLHWRADSLPMSHQGSPPCRGSGSVPGIKIPQAEVQLEKKAPTLVELVFEWDVCVWERERENHNTQEKYLGY